jgi:hypothetical protein
LVFYTLLGDLLTQLREERLARLFGVFRWYFALATLAFWYISEHLLDVGTTTGPTGFAAFSAIHFSTHTP